VQAGARIELDLRALMGKRARIHGSTMRARSLEEKAAATRLVEKAVLPGFASGDLSVPVTATFALDDVAAAYERFRAGGKLGKIVLTL
jgi:NADPH:quinone reductase